MKMLTSGPVSVFKFILSKSLPKARWHSSHTGIWTGARDHLVCSLPGWVEGEKFSDYRHHLKWSCFAFQSVCIESYHRWHLKLGLIQGGRGLTLGGR